MQSRIIGLLATVLVFAGIAAWLGYRAENVELDRAAAGAAASTDISEDIKKLNKNRELPEIDSLDFVERPLFWISRRPPVVEEAKADTKQADAAAKLPAALKITGVVRDGDTWFIVGTMGAKPLRMKTGEDLKGWTITEISPDNVTFTSGKKTATIKLFEPKPAEEAKKAKPPLRARKARAQQQQRQATTSDEKDE